MPIYEKMYLEGNFNVIRANQRKVDLICTIFKCKLAKKQKLWSNWLEY